MDVVYPKSYSTLNSASFIAFEGSKKIFFCVKPSKKEINIAKEWLTILHMAQHEKTSFKQLEYGQQRLLLIARAIVKQPTLLILDEPYQGLDYLGRVLVKNTLELIAKENLSQLLYVSHYQEDGLDSIQNYLEFKFDQASQCYKGHIE